MNETEYIEDLSNFKELTPFEQFQLAKYGDIIPEQEPEEPHEENR